MRVNWDNRVVRRAVADTEEKRKSNQRKKRENHEQEEETDNNTEANEGERWKRNSKTRKSNSINPTTNHKQKYKPASMNFCNGSSTSRRPREAKVR